MLIVNISTSGGRCCDQQHSFPSFQARLPARAAGAGGTLRWEQIDFKTASLHVTRGKNGTPSTHPLTGRELRELRRRQRESAKSPFVFVSERGAPFTAAGFSRMIERAGGQADLGIKVHAYMLRHACGYNSQTTGSTRARCRLTWGIAISRIRRATRRSRRGGLETSGGGCRPRQRTQGALYSARLRIGGQHGHEMDC